MTTATGDTGDDDADDGDAGESDDHEEIRTIVREEIHSVLDELKDLGGDGEEGDGSGDGDDTSSEPTSQRGIEERMRRIVEDSMKPLRDDIAKVKSSSKPAAPKKADPEPAPEEPKRRKLMEKLWS